MSVSRNALRKFNAELDNLKTVSNLGRTAHPNLLAELLMCGFCSLPAAEHTDTARDRYEFKAPCTTRDYLAWEVQYGFDYFQHGTSSITVAEDFSGPGTKETREDTTEFYDLQDDDTFTVTRHYARSTTNPSQVIKVIDPNSKRHAFTAHEAFPDDGIEADAYVPDYDFNAEAYYGDKDSEEYEGFDGKTYSRPTNAVIDYNDVNRNAFVEGFDGFSTTTVYDLTVTKRYHNKLVNAFINKANRLQVGSMETVSQVTPTGTNVHTRCVQGYCPVETFLPVSATTESKQRFVAAILRHGNNHAASWFRERPSFYKVHHEACDLKCGTAHFKCNANAPRQSPEDFLANQDLMSFLIEHHKYCQDASCKCSTWLRLSNDNLHNKHYWEALAA